MGLLRHGGERVDEGAGAMPGDDDGDDRAGAGGVGRTVVGPEDASGHRDSSSASTSRPL